MGTISGEVGGAVSRDELPLPISPLAASLVGTSWSLRKRKFTQIDFTGHTPKRACAGFFVLRGFICFPKIRILREV